MPESDRALVERARSGDGEAFEQLVRRHYRAAYATALAALGEPADAEDVCQDAFVRALERIEDCRQPERFAGWLLTIVRNRAHNWRRAARVRAVEPLGHVAAVARTSSMDVAERAELRDRLIAALRRLTPVQREVILLHDLEGWKHREIAESMDLPEGTVRSHLFYARRAMRATLGTAVSEEG